MARTRRKRRLFALLVILLFLLLFRLNPFLAGVLPGGGRWQDDPTPDAHLQGVLEVLVFRSEDRQPVQGVTLQVTDPDSGSQSATSDKEGRARIEGLSARPHRIDAQGASGIASAWSVPGERIQMSLRPRPRRRGQVLDQQGHPQPATVRLLDAEARVLASARTDKRGRYDLPDHDDAVAVCATPDRGAPGAAARGDIAIEEGVERSGRLPMAGPETVEIFAMVPDTVEDRLVPLRVVWSVARDGTFRGRLPREARAFILQDGHPIALDSRGAQAPVGHLVGRVIDAREQPVEGARIEARPLREGMPVVPFPDLWQATSDAQGHFRSIPLPMGHYALIVSAAGFARIRLPEVATDMADLRITLRRGYRVRGLVLDERGDPVGAALVVGLGTPDPYARFPAAHARTTDDGQFVLDRLGGDFARVQVKKPGYRTTTMMRFARNGNVTVTLRRD